MRHRIRLPLFFFLLPEPGPLVPVIILNTRVHPFLPPPFPQDGNGRAHRFFIQQALRRLNYVPRPGPVSWLHPSFHTRSDTDQLLPLRRHSSPSSPPPPPPKCNSTPPGSFFFCRAPPLPECGGRVLPPKCCSPSRGSWSASPSSTWRSSRPMTRRFASGGGGCRNCHLLGGAVNKWHGGRLPPELPNTRCKFQRTVVSMVSLLHPRGGRENIWLGVEGGGRCGCLDTGWYWGGVCLVRVLKVGVGGGDEYPFATTSCS